MNIDIVDNEKKVHEEIIKKMIVGSDRITIAVAFLKMTGLSKIYKELSQIAKEGATATFIIGIDFYQTEPQALSKIFSLTKKYKNIELYICSENNASFHPKLYFSEKGNKFFCLIGSANMTGGGLNKNYELSLLLNGGSSEKILDDTRKYIKGLVESSDTANPLILSQYKRKYEIVNKKVNSAKKAADNEISKEFIIDIRKLNKYVQEYTNDEDEKSDWKIRVKNYKEAKKVLNIITKRRFSSKNSFMEHYNKLVGGAGYDKLWHSGSIFRSKNKIADNYKQFCSFVKKIQKDITQAKEPEKIFENALNLSRSIDGLGVNVITEIMNTYDPKRYSVLNNNPLGALHKIGFQEFKSAQTFKPNNYQEFNDIMKDLSDKCDFVNLGQADHFCNYIYWKYVKQR